MKCSPKKTSSFIICSMSKESTKAVIFDGDGTLWRPAGTNKDTRPDNIYKGDKVEKDSHSSLSLVNEVREFLESLRARGYKIFVVSAHPVPGPEALEELKAKIVNLGIEELVDDFFCSDGGNKDGKTHVIQSIVQDFNLNPKNTYMVGDSYYYDYEAGLNAGVNSFFIKNDYCKQPSPLPNDVQLVENVTDLVVA